AGRHEKIFSASPLIGASKTYVSHPAKKGIIGRTKYLARNLHHHRSVLEVDARQDINGGGIRGQEQRACIHQIFGDADLCFSFYRNLPRGSELNSRNLFSSENDRQSIACKWKFRQWPDDEEVASVPRRRIDQATWLRDNVILGPANRTRPCQGHTRSRCPPPGTSGHHDLEQIRWPRLDPFRIRNSGLVNLKARHSIPFEEAQHLWRNQYVVMPGPSEIPHNRRIQDHR